MLQAAIIILSLVLLVGTVLILVAKRNRENGQKLKDQLFKEEEKEIDGIT